jgi:hypothetical protein
MTDIIDSQFISLALVIRVNQMGGHSSVDDGGVRIKGAGALRWLATLAMNKVKQNNLRTPVWDLLAMCASVYHQLLNQQGGTYDRHHGLIIHLPCPHCKGKSNGRERRAAVNDGGVRIKGAGAKLLSSHGAQDITEVMGFS